MQQGPFSCLQAFVPTLSYTPELQSQRFRPNPVALFCQEASGACSLLVALTHAFKDVMDAVADRNPRRAAPAPSQAPPPKRRPGRPPKCFGCQVRVYGRSSRPWEAPDENSAPRQYRRTCSPSSSKSSPLRSRNRYVPALAKQALSPCGMHPQVVPRVLRSALSSDPNRRTRQLTSRCQVCGCTLDDQRLFHKRYHICQEHMMAECIMRDGVPSRFCQQVRRGEAREDAEPRPATMRARCCSATRPPHPNPPHPAPTPTPCDPRSAPVSTPWKCLSRACAAAARSLHATRSADARRLRPPRVREVQLARAQQQRRQQQN